jgi:hypothetical protein
MNLAEIRQKYPQYNHVDDQKLADALHSKYYAHVPKEQFYSTIGLKTQPEQGFFNKLPRNIAAGLVGGAAGLANLPYEGAKLIGNPGAEYVPHFGEHDYGKMFGITGEPTTADKAIQFASSLALPVGAAGKAAGTGLKTAAKVTGGRLKTAAKAAADLPLTRGMAAKALKQAEKLAETRKVNINDKYIDLYHATTPENANKILQSSLLAEKYHPNFATLTDNPEAALGYSARKMGGDEVGDLLRIRIPEAEAQNFIHPEITNWATKANLPRGTENSKLFGIKKEIPAKYISKASNLAEETLSAMANVLEDIPQFLPNTEPYRKLMQAAKKGDYKSLFTLQSDLGKHAHQLTKSSSGAERLHGIEASKTRQRLIEAMRAKLAESGHQDIADLMAHGQNRYRQYNKLKDKVYKPALKVAKAAGAPVTLASIMELLYRASHD